MKGRHRGNSNLRFKISSTDRAFQTSQTFCIFFFNRAFTASKVEVLRHAGDLFPVPDTRDRWLFDKIYDNFWDRETVSGASPFERVEGDDDGNTLLSQSSLHTMFVDHSQGEGITINPHSILRMRIQRNEAASMDLRFKSKAQSTETYRKWMTEVLSVLGVVEIQAEAGVRKALDISMSTYVVRSHAYLELLISSWSMETHTFVASGGEFNPMSEDMVVMFSLTLLR